MSVEGVLNNLDQNSGEIKVRYCEETMTIDDSDNENSSLVLMGYPVEGVKIDEEPVSLFYKQTGDSIDENAVIFNDMRSVEEWLRNRTEIDYDTTRNDCLYYSSDEISVNNEVEQTVSPLITTVSEPGVLNINWDELVVNQNKPLHEQETEGIRLSSPKSDSISFSAQVVTEKNSSVDSQNELQAESCSVAITQDSTGKPESSLSKSLPFVKIPKDCLMRGKILGKGDISLLSGNSPISFLNNSIPINTAKVDSVLKNSVKPQLTHKPNILRSRSRTTLLKQPSNVNSEKSIMVVPVRSVDKVTKNSLANKLHKSRSILKNNTSNKNVSSEKSFPNTGTCDLNPKRPTSKKNTMPVALVAISTNKSENTTEIIIKTEDGENVYKGKTSDIMKATGSTIEYSSTQGSEEVTGTSTDKQEYDDARINELMVKLFGVTMDTLESYEGAPTQTHLKCPIDSCKYTSLKGSWLKVHVLQHYGIRPFKCDYPDCTWAFYTKFRLKRHQEIHNKKKEYRCPVLDCGRTFSTIYNVNNHLKLHDRPTAVTCQINGCNRDFQTRRSYEKHLQEHGIEFAPYVCPKEGCGKKYFTVNSLNSHSRIHQHNEEELRCSYCGKVFDQPCRLKAHINTHIGVKPYKCDFEGCMWAFTTSSKLRRHQRKHTQMRKHVCKVCEKSFLRPEHLKDHSIKHFVKKSFICPISDCSTVFANKSSMYAHLKRHRNRELKSSEMTSFPCPMDNCSLAFNTKESLRTHMQLSHVFTGLINTNENSQDTIQLLSDDNLITLEGLQGNTPNSGPGVVSFNSTSQEGLLVGMSDLVQCIPVMEYCKGDFSESESSNNIITHVVFTNDVEEKNQSLEETTELVERETNIGSARTGIPYKAGAGGKDKREAAGATGVTESLHSASDVVLSAGLLVGHDNLERGLLLQDELSGGDLYPSQEESGLLGTPGELQVLLLDPSSREQTSDFEQSTINLRDLE